MQQQAWLNSSRKGDSFLAKLIYARELFIAPRRVFQHLFQCPHCQVTFILAAQNRRFVKKHETIFLVQINCDMIRLCASQRWRDHYCWMISKAWIVAKRWKQCKAGDFLKKLNAYDVDRLMGALRYQQPRLILFHTNCEPDSEYWFIIKKIAASKMRVVQRSPPEFFWGKSIKVSPLLFLAILL